MGSAQATSFLGTGWSFPPEFVRPEGPDAVGQVLTTSDDEDIRASLAVLFSTGRGERFLNPKYGLDLREQLFESIGTTAKTYLVDRIRDGILIFEPRIEIVALDLDLSRAAEGMVLLLLEYAVRATNSRYNLVYPFYRSGDAIQLDGRLAPQATTAA